MRQNKKYSGSSNKSVKAEKEYLFAPKTQGQNTKYASFASVKEKIVQEAQKKYKYGSDVAKSLKDEKLVDLSKDKPQMKMPSKTDADEKKVEQRMFEIDYQEEVSRYLDRKTHLEENMKKAYTEIFTKYCTKTMQQRLEEHPDFSTFEDDPIKTMEIIRNTTHDTVRAQYPMVSIVDALARWINARQHEDKTLVDYTKRMKQLSDVVKSMIGDEILHKYVMETKEYKQSTDVLVQKDMRDNSYE